MNATAHSGRRPQIITEIGVAGLFLLLSLAAFFPLPLHMATRTLLGRVDKYIFIWDLWWVRTALTSADADLFHTTSIFHPQGAGLIFHTLFPLGGMLSLPLQALGGLIFSFNALTILATALSGWCTYLLARELFGARAGRIPAVLAGILFAFCAPRWVSTNLGHLNLVSNQWIPLYLLFIVRLVRRGRPLDGAAAGLWAAAILYTGYQQLVFTVYWSFLILVPLWPELSLRRHWRQYLAGLALTALVLGLLGLPVILGAREQGEAAVVRFDIGQARGLSLGLQQIFLTYPCQRFWHPAAWSAWLRGRGGQPAPGPPGEDGGWLRALGGWPGFGPVFGFCGGLVLLAGLFLPRRRGGGPEYLLWLVPPLFFAWMALGPHPTFFGVPFPGLYNRFFPIPVLGAVRGAYRFAVPLMLGAALAGALSCRGWIELLRDRAGGGTARRRLAAAALLLVQLLPLLAYLEFLRVPLPTERLPEPPAVYRSAAFRSRFAGSAVLELPLWVSGADFRYGTEYREHLWYQTVHGLPQVGGHVSRLTEARVAYFNRHPSLMRLTRARGTGGYDTATGADLRSTMEAFGVGVITVSRTRYQPEEERALLRFLERWLALEVLEQDRRFIVYGVAAGAPVAAAGADRDADAGGRSFAAGGGQ
jgi:hypothetical protein